MGTIYGECRFGIPIILDNKWGSNATLARRNEPLIFQFKPFSPSVILSVKSHLHNRECIKTNYLGLIDHI